MTMNERIPHEAGVAAAAEPAAFATGPMRRCSMCGLWKAQTEFHNSRTGQFSYCADCRRAYDRRYYAQRGRAARIQRKRAHRDAARAWMDSLKAMPCTDCGQVFPAWVMHWDHLPGYEKLDCIGSMVGSQRRTLVLDELKKCELVCANCHAVRTINRGRRGVAQLG